MSEQIEETLQRIQSHGGVKGTIVLNKDGIALKSTFDNAKTVAYAGLMSQLAENARGIVRDLDPSDDLTFFRIRSAEDEIMVAPDEDFTLIVVQQPKE